MVYGGFRGEGGGRMPQASRTSPFAMFLTFPFGTSLLEILGVPVASFLLPDVITQARHPLKLRWITCMENLGPGSRTWCPQRLHCCWVAAFPLHSSSVPFPQQGKGGVSSSPMSGFSLSTPFFYRVGLGGWLMSVKDRVTLLDLGGGGL